MTTELYQRATSDPDSGAGFNQWTSNAVDAPRIGYANDHEIKPNDGADSVAPVGRWG